MTVWKQNWAATCKLYIFLSSHFTKHWNKNAHNSDISLFDTVIFLPLGSGLFFSRQFILCSGDKTEEGKDIFECQIHT